MLREREGPAVTLSLHTINDNMTKKDMALGLQVLRAAGSCWPQAKFGRRRARAKSVQTG